MWLAILLVAAGNAVDFDVPWSDYHAAGEPALRELAWQRLQAAGWPGDFEGTLRRLREDRHEADVPTGILRRSRTDLDGLRYRYTVLVPESYETANSYPCQVVLHGSTRRPAWGDGEDHWRWIDPFRSEQLISVFPTAWEEAMWWSDRQIENLRAILDRLRADYSIDSNRCYLTGLSDGGTGTFYHALRSPTPWAAFLPLIGHPWVLGNPDEGADGDVFAANAFGRSLLVVNGETDVLYPASSLPPYLDLLRRAGAQVEFKTKPGGHNVRWWPAEAENFREFRAAHPRDPFPDELIWESDDPQRNGRCNWIVIREIGDAPQPELDPLNNVLFPELDPPTRAEAFPRRGPSGRVHARREGNNLYLTTQNVREFSLLLGVEEFDFARPIEWILDGEAHSTSIQPSLATMMEWSIRDGDPALLVAAELRLRVSP